MRFRHRAAARVRGYAVRALERELLDALEDQTPARVLRVTLEGMRDRGVDDFNLAWYGAMQRLRVQPNMSPDDAEELIEFKAWLSWARPLYEWAYTGAPGPAPELVDGQVFTKAESARLDLRRARATHESP